MKTAVLKTLPLFLAVGWVSVYGAGSKSPSMQETLSFIMDTLNSYGTSSLTGDATERRSYTLESLGGCRVTLTDHIRSYSKDGSTFSDSITEQSFDLSSIDPNTIGKTGVERGFNGGEDYPIVFGTRNSSRSIETRSNGNVGREWRTNEEATGEFVVAADSVATSLVKALRHAVILCGGRASLF